MNERVFAVIDRIQKQMETQVLQPENWKNESTQSHLSELQTIELYSQDLCEKERHRVLQEFQGWGPLCEFVEREDVSEIIINGPQNIWVEQKGHVASIEDRFASAVTYQNFLERIYDEAHSRPTLEFPISNGKISGFRLHVIGQELSGEFPLLTLRKHPKIPWNLNSLLAHSCFDEKDFSQLKKIVENRKNVLIVGGTGSGKTSLLCALMHQLPSNERVVIIEDTNELQSPNQVSAHLTCRASLADSICEIDLATLVKQSLRMRPDRIVVGEVRGGEAKDLLLALSTGHSGSMGTLHADDARQALMRLEMLIQMGAPQWQITTVRRLIFSSVQAIVVMKKMGNQRKLVDIQYLSGLEETGFLLDPGINF